jgi:phosphatidylglycerophosphate synthase
MDGFIARKLNIESRIGSYFDVIVDFVFISTIYLLFILKNIFPQWILFIIVAVFGEFILTNFYYNQTLYDPIGKYYGSILLGGIGLILVLEGKIINQVVIIGIFFTSIVVIFSRAIYLFLKKFHRN